MEGEQGPGARQTLDDHPRHLHRLDRQESITYTRMRAPYINPEGFRFTIYRKSIFSDLGKFLGMQDIEVSDPDFDEAFIIKGNDDSKVQSLFSDSTIRQMIQAQPGIRLEVKDTALSQNCQPHATRRMRR